MVIKVTSSLCFICICMCLQWIIIYFVIVFKYMAHFNYLVGFVGNSLLFCWGFELPYGRDFYDYFQLFIFIEVAFTYSISFSLRFFIHIYISFLLIKLF